VPPEPIWTPLPLPAETDDVSIEPLAMHVPLECFYIRFGKFSNYLWMNKLFEEYGGDLDTMITLRSYLAPMNKRVQAQLGLQQNLLAELLGDQVIGDVALIGRDTFIKEGAAIGILFQAKSNDILRNDLTSQRSRAFAKEKERGATSETVQIAGREAASSPTACALAHANRRGARRGGAQIWQLERAAPNDACLRRQSLGHIGWCQESCCRSDWIASFPRCAYCAA
jgi:hypothetical protein